VDSFYMLLIVCVCVVSPTLWGPNAPTRIVLRVNGYLMRTFCLDPIRKTAYKSNQIKCKSKKAESCVLWVGLGLGLLGGQKI